MDTKSFGSKILSFLKSKDCKRLIILALICYFFPKIFLFFVVCGIIDVARNAPLDKDILKKYFLGSGDITWFLSPLNLFFDLLTLSSKAVYKLQDLPQACQDEINSLINNTNKEKLIAALVSKMEGKDRGMIFFKWYGKNIHNSIHFDEYHKEFKYIKTIGVSAFNKHQSTSRHFGPMRITLRVLYNLNPTQNNGVYIQVSSHKHYWHDKPLFIFDDTHIHQSFNNSDQIRYCMFIDIVRPSYLHVVLNGAVQLMQMAMLKINKIFYNKWDFIK